MKIKNSSNDVFARIENGRIAYYRRENSDKAQFWKEHWERSFPSLTLEYYRSYLRGFLGHGNLARIFLKYLPCEGRILEGGCGMSQYVVALRARGYDCRGIDFSPQTVERVKEILPDLPIKYGDICQTDFPDESISAYISLGVMEHFKEGPEKALREAKRVLKQNSFLLVSVPQVFEWRKAVACPENEKLPVGSVFYQYAFAAEEFRKNLTDNGFSIVAEYGYGSHFAFRLRFGWVRMLLRRFPAISCLDFILDRIAIFRDMARMRMYIAKKD